MYVLEAGQSMQVEANPDAIGLKVGIIYNIKDDRQELLFHRFTCKNDSILIIKDLNQTDFDYGGGLIS
jgi:hypothetical protein